MRGVEGCTGSWRVLLWMRATSSAVDMCCTPKQGEESRSRIARIRSRSLSPSLPAPGLPAAMCSKVVLNIIFTITLRSLLDDMIRIRDLNPFLYTSKQLQRASLNGPASMLLAQDVFH